MTFADRFWRTYYLAKREVRAWLRIVCWPIWGAYRD